MLKVNIHSQIIYSEASPTSSLTSVSPNTSETPSPSYSNSTSPASWVSLAMSLGIEDFSAKICAHDSSPNSGAELYSPGVEDFSVKIHGHDSSPNFITTSPQLDIACHSLVNCNLRKRMISKASLKRSEAHISDVRAAEASSSRFALDRHLMVYSRPYTVSGRGLVLLSNTIMPMLDI